MQIKVRTRCKNPTCKMYTTCPECKGTGWGEEEWKSADVIFSGLNERIKQLETSFRNVAIDVNNRIERLEEGRRLLIERSHDQQRRIQCLEAEWAAEHATYCQRCGEEYIPIPHMDQGLCEECVSDLAEEQATMLLPYPDEEP